MPINKIVPSKRGKAAISAAMLTVIMSGSAGYFATKDQPPPPAVVLAVDHLIKPWEGLVLKSHWDPYAKIYDICYGETQINGKPVTAGMSFSKAECDAMLSARVSRDYYEPLTKCIPDFAMKPVSLQASLTSGAYNFGTSAACRSTAANLARANQYRAACEAQTAFNKAGGKIVNGLVNRREMGDAQRIGEAELCVSGLN
ncbi:glycoside hydrolase [Rhizobium altiplani]|uniref:Lysozyme n=1 Tax=Rhizobium altiplani TaxID=1864509 RepID=A0A109J4I1_9HYPH|nr:lysozyme [Rhizobium altiplani]KWV42144.1 glycoside hydrolase [Rhizobium altiplani]